MYEPVYDVYNNSHSAGHLPPIHSIGKGTTVDEDEPPDIPYVYESDAHTDLAESSTESVFDVSDAEASDAFLCTLSSTSKHSAFLWREDQGSTVSNICLQSPAPAKEKCSEYEQESSEGNADDIRGSLSSLNSTMLHIGDLQVPDLSSQPSPLQDFLEQEQRFAENFLQVVCWSTSLLRKKESTPSYQTHSTQNKEVKASPRSRVVGLLDKVQHDSPVQSKSDSRRKTVSWGDCVDSSVRSHTTALYMNLLWQQFGRNLDLFLDEPAWAGRMGLLRSELGTISLYSDATLAVLRLMIEHACLKDVLPPGSVSPLLGAVVRLHALSAFAAWDTYVCGANSSHGSDKCYPFAGDEDQYSTQSGQLLHSSHRALLSLLQDIFQAAGYTQHDYLDLHSQYDLDLGLVSGISSRLVACCQLSHKWCTNKLHHTLSSWNTKTYLFVSSTDLRILRQGGKRLCQVLQMLLNSRSRSTCHTCLSDQLFITHISHSAEQASSLNLQLQSLEDCSVKQFTEKLSQVATSFFQENLPPPKVWRCRISPEFPEDPNCYIQPLWNNLLAPVTEAVTRLPEGCQLELLRSAISCLCATWTSAFLKNKIKFSFYGAQQLGVDMDHLRRHISDCALTSEIRREVLELSVFRQFSGIVQLLKRQPMRRPTSRFRKCSAEDLSCDTRDASPSPSASHSELHANMEEMQDSNDVCLVPNPEEWLALRVVGGSRNWHLPACFKRL